MAATMTMTPTPPDDTARDGIFCKHGHADPCVKCENESLRNALTNASTVLHSMRQMFEELSDGKSGVALISLRRYHDMVSSVLAEMERIGVEPAFKVGPPD